MSKFGGIKNGLLEAIEYTKGNCIEHSYSNSKDFNHLKNEMLTPEEIALLDTDIGA